MSEKLKVHLKFFAQGDILKGYGDILKGSHVSLETWKKS